MREFLPRRLSNQDHETLQAALSCAAQARGGDPRLAGLAEKLATAFHAKRFETIEAEDGAWLLRALRLAGVSRMLDGAAPLASRESDYDRIMAVEAHLRRRFHAAFSLPVEDFPVTKRDLLFPRGLYVEPTGACNLRCSFCPTYESDKAKVLLDWGLFERIVDEARPFMPMDFLLHKDGEPFLHPRFLDMVELIKRAHADNYVNFSTNGYFLDDARVSRLIAAGPDRVVVGVRAATPETYLAIHKRNGYARVVENVRRLLAAKRKAGAAAPKVVVQIVESAETLGELDAFVEQWSHEDVDVEIKRFQTWGGARSDATVAPLAARAAAPYACLYLWRSLAINADGVVSMCCYDWSATERAGDLRTMTIREIWHGEPMREYRRRHLLGRLREISLCAGCLRWRSFDDAFHVASGAASIPAGRILRRRDGARVDEPSLDN